MFPHPDTGESSGLFVRQLIHWVTCVISKLMQLCVDFLDFLQAVWNFSGGSLVGPTGTGKTETVKVLSFIILESALIYQLYIVSTSFKLGHDSLSSHKIAKQHNNVCKLMFKIKCTGREGI